MKKILILGAGIYQVPLIKKAQKKGYYTIVASIRGNYPGFQFADKIYYENTTDMEAILNIAISEQIDAILTTGTDVAVRTIGYVCDKLGLTGISKKSAEWVTNKAFMKKKLVNNHVRTAEYERVFSLEEAYVASERIGLPVMFKCVDKSGSRGIIKVEQMGMIERAFQYAFSYTALDYIVVEKFVEGVEIGVDGYIGEKDAFIVPHDKIVYDNGMTGVPIGHSFPSLCSEEIKKDICNEIKKALAALEMRNTFFNADVMIKNNRCFIIEIGARCGATCIPELISIHYGVDYYEKMLDNALGRKIEFPHKPLCASVGELLISKKSGEIKEIQADIDKCDGIEEVIFDYKSGECVNRFEVGPDRIGHVIVKGDTIEMAIKNLENVKKHISIKII